ncbi:MAG TPA: hypothetical protein VJN44_13055 [Roseateles sp.]|nr:hypothetical protein [Roseateles sp.]
MNKQDHLKTGAPGLALAMLLLLPLLAQAQVQCWASQEDMDAARDKRFAVQLAWMKKAEQIIRRNKAYLEVPEPVRMRTTTAAGPYHPSGARLFVRAYPEQTTVGNIRIWTGACDVIPQAERVAASIGQIDVFFNVDVKEMFLQTGMPSFEGMVGGYPRYNGWVVITKDGRTPWIPQTLADRLDAETGRRERALADWLQQLSAMKPPDMAQLEKSAEMMRKTDPAGADRMMASVAETARELGRQQREVYPATTAQFEKELADVRRYRASFSAEQLRQPAVWTDGDGAGKRQLEARVRELNTLSPEEEQLIKSRAQSAVAVRNARREKVAPLLRDAQASHDLAYLKPGTAAQAIAYKPDPQLPDMQQPDRLQLIALLFSEDPRRQRGPWMKAAKDGFDFAALAALLD